MIKGRTMMKVPPGGSPEGTLRETVHSVTEIETECLCRFDKTVFRNQPSG